MIALCVLGATSPATLRPLLDGLDPSEFHCHLHVDATVDLEGYLAQVGPSAVSATVLSERFDVYWGGWSMIEATLALMRSALADPVVEVLTLVSDDSAPVVGLTTLAERLRERPLRITRYEVGADFRRDRYERSYFLDAGFASARALPVEQRAIEIDTFRRVAADLEELSLVGKASVQLHNGPQWWSLDRRTALHVLHRIETDRRLELSFRYAAVPDESLIQTLVAELHGSSLNLMPDSSPMLFDFTRKVKPHLFERVDEVVEFVRSSGQHDKLFVRKVSVALAHELCRGGLLA